MTATLSFELKGVMKHLSKDERWNVLTVLILHANIRNRAYPSMQTIADMATGGNLHKATAAKKWLEKHGAFELVAYGKRVDDEKALGKRQHIYQLLGILRGCGDPECDCWQSGEYRYLYFNKQGKPEIVPTDNITMRTDIVPTDNITSPEIVDGDNIKAGDIVPTDNVNGYKGSITREKKKKTHTSKPNLEQHRAAIIELMRVDGYDPAIIKPDDLTRKEQEKYLDAAAQLADSNIPAAEIPALHKTVKAHADANRWSVKVTSAALLKHSGKYIQARAKAKLVTLPIATNGDAPPEGEIDIEQRVADLTRIKSQLKGA